MQGNSYLSGEEFSSRLEHLSTTLTTSFAVLSFSGCELVPCVTMSPLDLCYKYSIQHGDVIIFFFASASHLVSHPIYAALNKILSVTTVGDEASSKNLREFS
eukprot:scaffold4732_cov100-Skeletonema_marinoi.AAC.1